jgi:hypothetical protein
LEKNTPLLVALASYIYKTRNASPSHLRGVWTKRATVNGGFHYFYETRY